MYRCVLVLILALGLCGVVYGADETASGGKEQVQSVTSQAEDATLTQEEANGNITLDFKDADIRSVLKIISLKSGVNIVASPDVTGTVSVYLDNVNWEKALDVILKTYGFGYEKKGNIISVAPLDKLTEQRRIEQELTHVQPTVTEVFKLKYIDALDASKALEPLVSSRGKITVLEVTGKSGWEFGGEALGKKETKEKGRKSLTKVLLITDIPPVIEQLKLVLKEIDMKPRQIMIEAKILEVSKDYLDDIGFEYSTQEVGASDITIDGSSSKDLYGVGGRFLSGNEDTITPSVFQPAASDLSPENAGLQLILKKLMGSKFEVIFHMLEEDVNSNLLSAPRITTLDNQEATILVGEKYPILSTDVSGTDTTTTTTSLDYYQDIGIQLNVIPQICGGDKINMIIHPAVTSFTQTVGTNAYPRITTREAETQVIMNNGETLVIGGLIKDYENTSKIGAPFLSKIPFLGVLFKRDTNDTAKIELLIFITATIVDESGIPQIDTEVAD
ncbi:MAG: secretin and TonB N-terminal domain-containing protein [Candidatus Omnitrophica bacterium]|nr:secretin and TonB N-terminal domain-containing protein [Candidatus Omnitrophota bacterium]MDD5355437.1 secretin and TonB N-terminal domain-containing protein [Candidatus Omnitrophota bacterium]